MRSVRTTTLAAAVAIAIAIVSVALIVLRPPPANVAAPGSSPSRSAGSSAAATSPTVSLPSPRVVDVREMGARGDGAVSDSKAFERARDAAGSGGSVRVPAGRYLLDADLQLLQAGQRWAFDPAAFVTGALVMLRADGIELSGGDFDQSIVVMSSHSAVRGAHVHDTRGYRGGIYVAAGSNANVIDGNRVERSSSSGINVGEDGSRPATGNRVTNNTVSDSGEISIEIYGNSPESYVAGNITRGGLMGISVDKSDRTTVEHNDVTAASNNRGFFFGLEVAGAHDAVLRDNNVDGDGFRGSSGVVGVSISSGSRNAQVSGNVLLRVRIGIDTSSGSAKKRPTAGQLSSNTVDGYQESGINIHDVDNYTLADNVLRGGSAGSKCINHDHDTQTIERNNVCEPAAGSDRITA